MVNEVTEAKVDTKTNHQIQFVPLGSTGIRNWSGYIQEDYLHFLNGRQAADIFDKMRRSDTKVKKVLKAVTDPIIAANWEVLHKEDTPDAILQKEFIEHILFKDMADDADFYQVLREMLTFMTFGKSVHEVIHKTVIGHKKFGDYIGIRRLAFRSARTIERFNLNKDTEELVSVSQAAYGDAQKIVDLDARFLLILTLDREGANWDGVSMLRSCYGAWKRKQDFLKLLAIGIEKFAIPTAIGKVPQLSGDDYDEFVQALEKYTSHEANYITLPNGWEITLQASDFDPAKVRETIAAENMEIVDAFIANFLELAMGSSSGGSYALSSDLSTFFLSGITQIAYLIAEAFNRRVIRPLIDLNFGPQEEYPELAANGISDKAGLQLAQSLNQLAAADIIRPDDKLEEHLRRRYDLPPADPATAREKPAPVSPFGGPAPAGTKPGDKEDDDADDANANDDDDAPDDGEKDEEAKASDKTKPKALSEKSIRLAEKKAKKLIKSGTEKLRDVFEEGLSVMGEKLIDDLMRASEKVAQDKSLTAIKQVDVKGKAAYRKEVKRAMAEIALAAIESARAEIPGGSKVKFSESVRLDDDIDVYLPKKVKRNIEAQAELLVDTQAADLKKHVLHQYVSSAPSTDSAATLADDLAQALNKYVSGSAVNAAAGNTSAQVINRSRRTFFDEPEVTDQIEAFQFVNGDPVSPICQDLAGTIFAKDDPQGTRFEPPLHHNCKSFIVPILKGNLKGREVKSLKPSRASLEKFITLGEGN